MGSLPRLTLRDISIVTYQVNYWVELSDGAKLNNPIKCISSTSPLIPDRPPG